MKPFEVKMCNKLLYLLRAGGVTPDDAATFFGQQVIAMQSCPPNYTKKNNNTYAKLEFYDGEFWVMRGFYPNLPVMFKVVMVDSSSFNKGERYYAKVTLITPTIQKKHSADSRFDDKVFMQLASDKANNILLGDTKPEPKIVLTQRHPKCMSPKGCPVFNLRLKD